MKEMGNPFQEETADLITLDTKIIATPDSGNMVKSHYKTGQSRFKAFIGGLDKGDEGSFYDPSKKNTHSYFVSPDRYQYRRLSIGYPYFNAYHKETFHFCVS